MGGRLYFNELYGVSENGELSMYVRINDLESLEEEIKENFSNSITLSTKTGSEYPRYEYLRGLHYKSDKPYPPYFIDNLYPPDYRDLFSLIGKHTESFVVLAAERFPRIDEIFIEEMETEGYIFYVDGDEIERTTVEMTNGGFEETAKSEFDLSSG